MLDSLIFADEPRAGDRALIRRLARGGPDRHRRVLRASAFSRFDRLGLQPAVGQFLDPVREPVFQEAPVVGRRLGFEEVAPLLLELRDAAAFSVRPNAPEPCRSIQASWSLEGVGMTALVGGTVERTFSAVGR